MQHSASAERVVLNTAAQTLLRLLIASYFLAVALGLIPGTDLGVLFASVLPAPINSALATGLVFVLAFMIMIGMHIRLAALLLGLMTFFASYLSMVNLGVADELGHFWRDLALIAGLVLTYGDTHPSGRRGRRIISRTVLPRRVRPTTVPPFPHAVARLDRPKRRAPGNDRATSRDSGTPAHIDNIFVA